MSSIDLSRALILYICGLYGIWEISYSCRIWMNLSGPNLKEGGMRE